MAPASSRENSVGASMAMIEAAKDQEDEGADQEDIAGIRPNSSE
jgi:hypothetical protein